MQVTIDILDDANRQNDQVSALLIGASKKLTPAARPDCTYPRFPDDRAFNYPVIVSLPAGIVANRL